MICIGYARVSTTSQDLEYQRASLATAGCQRIFEEKVSGATMDRPELVAMLGHLREGDLVIVTRLDRLARSTRDLLAIAEQIQDRGAGLRSLAEPWADTTSAPGRMVLTIFAGIADFERSLILERCDAGRRAAVARGIKFGRKRKLSPERLEYARILMDSGKQYSEVALIMGVSHMTLRRAFAQNPLAAPPTSP